MQSSRPALSNARLFPQFDGKDLAVDRLVSGFGVLHARFHSLEVGTGVDGTVGCESDNCQVDLRKIITVEVNDTLGTFYSKLEDSGIAASDFANYTNKTVLGPLGFRRMPGRDGYGDWLRNLVR